MSAFSFALKFIAFIAILVILVPLIGVIILAKHRRHAAEDGATAIQSAPDIRLQSVEPYAYPVTNQMPAFPQKAVTTATLLQRWGDMERGYGPTGESYPIKLDTAN